VVAAGRRENALAMKVRDIRTAHLDNAFLPGRDPRAEYELVPTVERVAAKRRPRRMCLCGLGVLSGELSAATDPTH